MTSLHDQTLALASMFQSATLINQLAHGQKINQAAFDCSFDSLFTLDANSVQEIYGYGEGLLQGLKMLITYFSAEEKHPERLIAYYVFSMIKLESRLRRNKLVTEAIQKGVAQIEKQAQTFDISKSTKIHKVDGLYQQTISQVKPRIIVQGEQVNLTSSDTTSRIRSLLFAGIRAAVLWKQRGGSRFSLIFSRKKYLEQARQILERIQ
jgi:high frequency lysogenization protein